MIHWGSDVPTNTTNSQGATPPSGYCSDDELTILKPVTQKLFWSSNPRLARSLTHLNHACEPTTDFSGCRRCLDNNNNNDSNSSSQSNLVATIWLNRNQMPKRRLQRNLSSEGLLDDDDTLHDNMVKVPADRKRSKSLEDIRSDVLNFTAPSVFLDIDSPASICENDHLSVYMSVINNSHSEVKVSACLRVDAGLKKVKTRTQNILVEGRKSSQLQVLIKGSELWQNMSRTEDQFTILATVKNHDDGSIISKIDHVKIYWKKMSLTRATKNLFSSSGANTRPTLSLNEGTSGIASVALLSLVDP